MPQIKLDNLATMLPIEPAPAETDTLQPLSAGTDSFDNLLQRARSRPDEPNVTAGGEPRDTKPSRRLDDERPTAGDRSDNREDSAPVESADREQPAVQDADDATENRPDEPSDEDTAAEPARAATDLRDNTGSRHGTQDLTSEQDNVAQQSPTDKSAGRPVAEVQSEAAAPMAGDEVLLQTTAETPDTVGEKSERPADDAGKGLDKPMRAGGKHETVAAAVEQIERHAGQTEHVADGPDSEDLPAEAPQSPRRSRAQNIRAVKANDNYATHQVAETSTVPNSAAVPSAQAMTMEATVGAESHAEPAAHAAEPSSNDAAGSQNETSTRNSGAARPASAEASKGPQQAAGGDGIDRVRFVQRVARAFEAIGDRSRTVRLRLSPPELGSLRLDVTVRNGTMNAQVEAETATARNLLLDNLGALRERLAQQDIKIDQFNVDLTGRSPGGPFDEPTGQMQGQEGDSANNRNDPTPRRRHPNNRTRPSARSVDPVKELN